jgi:hypothetical protein
MKIVLAISAVALLLTGCAQPQYTYYQPQPVYYQPQVYVAPRPYYVVPPRCYWTQRYVPQYHVYQRVRVCS